eukprot:tig00000581_g2238.t1
MRVMRAWREWADRTRHARLTAVRVVDHFRAGARERLRTRAWVAWVHALGRKRVAHSADLERQVSAMADKLYEITKQLADTEERDLELARQSAARRQYLTLVSDSISHAYTLTASPGSEAPAGRSPPRRRSSGGEEEEEEGGGEGAFSGGAGVGAGSWPGPGSRGGSPTRPLY